MAAFSTARFSTADINIANKVWKCTCGPVALAVILDINLDEARSLAGPHYRGWMNPTQMKEALMRAGASFTERDRDSLYRPDGPRQWACPMVATHGITRIQFDGPWTAPGVPASVAYRYTHWVASVTTAPDGCADVFDINWGWMSFGEYVNNMRELAMGVPQGTGVWWPTHAYEITPR